MIHVLALLARAGHGKTTVARHLETVYGARVVSLAGPLKRAAQAVMGFSDAQLYGTQAEKEALDPRYGFSARTFLQKLGTEGLRENFGQMIHCEALANTIAIDFGKHFPCGQDAVYVIDDARFPNEVDFVNRLDRRESMPRMFGRTLKIICTDAPPSSNDNHPSEAGIDAVMPYQIASEVISSRAEGVKHLVQRTEAALTQIGLRGPLERCRAQTRRDLAAS